MHFSSKRLQGLKRHPLERNSKKISHSTSARNQCCQIHQLKPGRWRTRGSTRESVIAASARKQWAARKQRRKVRQDISKKRHLVPSISMRSTRVGLQPTSGDARKARSTSLTQPCETASLKNSIKQQSRRAKSALSSCSRSSSQQAAKVSKTYRTTTYSRLGRYRSRLLAAPTPKSQSRAKTTKRHLTASS